MKVRRLRGIPASLEVTHRTPGFSLGALGAAHTRGSGLLAVQICALGCISHDSEQGGDEQSALLVGTMSGLWVPICSIRARFVPFRWEVDAVAKCLIWRGLRRSQRMRAVSSVGRASRLHREGRGFEPLTAHHRKSPENKDFISLAG